MMKNRLVPLLAVTTVVLGACVVHPAHDPYYVYDDRPVRLAPPPLQYENPGPPPVVGHIWIGGFWNWIGTRYVWVTGRWEAPRPGHVWVPHRWDRDGDHWRRHGGRWEPAPQHHYQPPPVRVVPAPEHRPAPEYRPQPHFQPPPPAPLHRFERPEERRLETVPVVPVPRLERREERRYEERRLEGAPAVQIERERVAPERVVPPPAHRIERKQERNEREEREQRRGDDSPRPMFRRDADR